MSQSDTMIMTATFHANQCRDEEQEMHSSGSAAITNRPSSVVLKNTPNATARGISEDSLSSSNTTSSSTSPTLTHEKIADSIVAPHEDDLAGNAQHKTRTWQPSVLRVGPLSGLCALGFGVLQILAAYAILRASNGDEVANWRYQPTVYLAALTAVSNKALAFAAVQATVVTFWVRALQGSTLGQLHRDWAYGLHVLRAITAGRRTNLLALACICTTFVAIDGALLQRASSVVLRVPNKEVAITVSVSPELPSYSTGYLAYQKPGAAPYLDWTPDFVPFVKNFNREETISGGILGCDDGTCTAKVRAPALAVENCTTYSKHRNFTIPITSAEQERLNVGGVLPLNRSIHIVDAWGVNGTTEYLVLRTAYPDDQISRTCAGYMLYTDCYYASAIAEYEVSITNNTIANLGFDAALNPPIIAKANNTAITDQTIQDFGLLQGFNSGLPQPIIQTTLAGILSITIQQFYARAVLFPGHNGTGSYLSSTPNWKNTPTIPKMAWYGFDHMKNFAAWDNGDPGACAPAYTDEHAGIAAEMNRMMFRAGFWFAQNFNHSYLASMTDPGLDFNYTTTGILRTPTPFFSSDFSYFAGAAAIQITTILVLLINFSGFWKLGRPVTFSPLEIAKAFDASILQSVGPVYQGYELAKIEGSRKIQYGVVTERTPPPYPVVEKLMIADEMKATRPRRNWQLV